MKYYWKVLTLDRKSVNDPKSKWAIYYPINKKTTPILPHSKLFIFNTKKDAKSFLNLYDIEDALIVKCKATNVTKALGISAGGAESVLKWWQQFNNKENAEYQTCPQSPPYGTLWADSVTCLE